MAGCDLRQAHRCAVIGTRRENGNGAARPGDHVIGGTVAAKDGRWSDGAAHAAVLGPILASLPIAVVPETSGGRLGVARYI
jgi:hypothetical protein